MAAAALAAARRAGEWSLAAVRAARAARARRCPLPAGGCSGGRAAAGSPDHTETLDDLRDHVEAYGARFDGRLRVATVDRRTGRRVVFGRPGAPHATVADAVTASCAVPWLFAPVTIAGREYVDGGVWSPTNLDAAPVGRDTHVLCLNPTAGINGTHTLVSVARGSRAQSFRSRPWPCAGGGRPCTRSRPTSNRPPRWAATSWTAEPRRRVLAAGYRQGLQLATVTPR